jgi:hypothetical protein
MRFGTNCGKRWADSQEWHRWFAWRPVAIDDEYAWLEWIERKRVVIPWHYWWDYRLLDT